MITFLIVIANAIPLKFVLSIILRDDTTSLLYSTNKGKGRSEDNRNNNSIFTTTNIKNTGSEQQVGSS